MNSVNLHYPRCHSAQVFRKRTTKDV
ncbi:hypothetical protein I6U52_25220 [Serratia marcescens]|nr:hypothetical protein [Serratia marcescens]MBH2866155.1 hypothetical protein [Serratia marcescens]MBW4239736.1 hypothetical protein [Enterobacter roggenkampii]